MNNGSEFVTFIMGIALATLFWIWIVFETLTPNIHIKSGKQFIIDASSYKCLETKSLKKDE